MQARFIYNGDSIDYTPNQNVSAGEVIVLGHMIGVAKVDIPAGQLGALALTGVFEMPKTVSIAMTIGQPVAWDHINHLIQQASVPITGSEDPTPNVTNCGHVVKEALADETTVWVRLSQSLEPIFYDEGITDDPGSTSSES